MRTLTILMVVTACLSLTMLSGCSKDAATQAKDAAAAANDGDTKPLMAMVDEAKKLAEAGKMDEAKEKCDALQAEKDMPAKCKTAVAGLETAIKAAKAKEALKNVKIPGTE